MADLGVHGPFQVPEQPQMGPQEMSAQKGTAGKTNSVATPLIGQQRLETISLHQAPSRPPPAPPGLSQDTQSLEFPKTCAEAVKNDPIGETDALGEFLASIENKPSLRPMFQLGTLLQQAETADSASYQKIHEELVHTLGSDSMKALMQQLKSSKDPDLEENLYALAERLCHTEHEYSPETFTKTMLDIAAGFPAGSPLRKALGEAIKNSSQYEKFTQEASTQKKIRTSIEQGFKKLRYELKKGIVLGQKGRGTQQAGNRRRSVSFWGRRDTTSAAQTQLEEVRRLSKQITQMESWDPKGAQEKKEELDNLFTKASSSKPFQAARRDSLTQRNRSGSLDLTFEESLTVTKRTLAETTPPNTDREDAATIRETHNAIEKGELVGVHSKITLLQQNRSLSRENQLNLDRLEKAYREAFDNAVGIGNGAFARQAIYVFEGDLSKDPTGALEALDDLLALALETTENTFLKGEVAYLHQETSPVRQQGAIDRFNTILSPATDEERGKASEELTALLFHATGRERADLYEYAQLVMPQTEEMAVFIEELFTATQESKIGDLYTPLPEKAAEEQKTTWKRAEIPTAKTGEPGAPPPLPPRGRIGTRKPPLPPRNEPQATKKPPRTAADAIAAEKERGKQLRQEIRESLPKMEAYLAQTRPGFRRILKERERKKEETAEQPPSLTPEAPPIPPREGPAGPPPPLPPREEMPEEAVAEAPAPEAPPDLSETPPPLPPREGAPTESVAEEPPSQGDIPPPPPMPPPPSPQTADRGSLLRDIEKKRMEATTEGVGQVEEQPQSEEPEEIRERPSEPMSPNLLDELRKGKKLKHVEETPEKKPELSEEQRLVEEAMRKRRQSITGDESGDEDEDWD